MKRKEQRWNVLDVGLLLLALFCVASAGGRIWEKQKNKNTVAEQVYLVVLYAEEIPTETAGCLVQGETLYFETGIPLGTLTELFTVPSEVRLLSNGQYYTGTSEAVLLCDMTLWVEVRGVLKDGALACGDVRLIPGGEVKARSLRGDWRLRVLSVD